MPEELTEAQKTGEQPTGRVEAMLSGIENLLHRVLLSTAVKSNNTTEIPYYGPDASLYALHSGDFPTLPIANYNGEITLSSLKRAFAELNGDDGYIVELFTKEQRVQAMRKILASYHAVMLDDSEFETQVQSALNAEKEPDPVVQESGESLSEGAKIFEFAFSGEANLQTVIDGDAPDNNIIYRNILRTGTWKVAPNGSQEPLVISKEMLDNIVTGFNDGAFEYVTVPETHQDLPSQNRGFIRNVSVVEDPQRAGEYILRGGFEFTNDDAKRAAVEGSIAGVSCGIVFNHPRKSDGKIYDIALHHVALTNKPWIDGLGGWETIAASEFGAEVVVGLEDNTNVGGQENTNMPDENTMTLSQDEINALLAENKRLKLAQERTKIADLLRPYQTDKHITPAVLTQAEKLMLAAVATPKMMSLSEDNAQVEIDLAETVKALLDAMPAGTDLSETPVTPDQTAPPATTATKTAEEQAAELRQLTGFKPITE